MWKESATRASEWTAYPAISSTKKKIVSIARRMRILVDLEGAMLAPIRAELLETSKVLRCHKCAIAKKSSDEILMLGRPLGVDDG